MKEEQEKGTTFSKPCHAKRAFYLGKTLKSQRKHDPSRGFSLSKTCCVFCTYAFSHTISHVCRTVRFPSATKHTAPCKAQLPGFEPQFASTHPARYLPHAMPLPLPAFGWYHFRCVQWQALGYSQLRRRLFRLLCACLLTQTAKPLFLIQTGCFSS